MHPTASLLNIHLSIEKFLWDRVASAKSVMLVHQDDTATRLQELLETEIFMSWHTTGLAARNTGEITLYAGATTTKDPGGIKRLVLLDLIKESLDTAAGIPVLEYQDTGLIVAPENKVNELVIIGPVMTWPAATDTNIGYTTKFVSQKLKFAQQLN